MSNPLRAPKIEARVMSAVPSAYFDAEDPAYCAWVSQGRKVEYVQERLASRDMVPRNSIILPRALCADPAVLTKKGPAFALAKSGKPQFRVRSGEAFGLLGEVYGALPEGGVGGREVVASAVRQKFYVDAGTEATLGRLGSAYPAKGAAIRCPVTRAEAEAALDRCGLRVDRLPRNALRPFPLLAAEHEQAVTVNKKSDNGFPVLGTWETPGASALCLELAVGLRKELVAASKGEGVEAFVRRMEQERPFMAAVRGKAKADYYNAEKIKAGKLRFYNAFPRPVMLNMQVATQALEAMARTVLVQGHSGIGVSLHHGGAARLVDALEAMLRETGTAYVHVGDDSWVIVREGEELVGFALDCSNFDLTQHHDATREVHAAVRRQLECIDTAAAGLWHAYARSRLVVVCGSLVYEWRHAGPSGAPLQSKVNDMLMDVLIDRVLSQRATGKGAEWWDSTIQRTGKDLGFDVRVEQFARVRARSVLGFLEQVPFLFVGYYFHVREGEVQVCTDIPRTLAQLPYPGLKWMKTDQERLVMEAMRLGSMVLSAGLPTPQLEPAYGKWRAAATALVRRAVETAGDVHDERLRWAVGEAVFGPQAEPSLRGLLAALGRDPRKLWMEAEKELPSTSELLYPQGGSWADEVEEAEEAEALRAGGTRVPAAAVLPAPRFVRGEPPPTHPTTSRNHGRFPPTARWGPNKQPRVREKRVQRRGRVLSGESENEWEAQSEDWTDDEGYLTE